MEYYKCTKCNKLYETDENDFLSKNMACSVIDDDGTICGGEIEEISEEEYLMSTPSYSNVERIIEARIMLEYAQNKDKNWAKLAASKITSVLFQNKWLDLNKK